MELNQLTGKIIGSAIEVHRHLGPGLLESTYQKCLKHELQELGLSVKEELALPLAYKDIYLEYGYRIDLLVENTIVIELKTVEFIKEVHKAQTLTYLRLGQFPIGLLINFNVSLLKDGITRIINSEKKTQRNSN